MLRNGGFLLPKPRQLCQLSASAPGTKVAATLVKPMTDSISANSWDRPTFKKKGQARDSFYVANDKFHLVDRRVKLPIIV